MPNSISGLIILVFGILPGFPAYSIYQKFLGPNLRETELEKIIKIFLFSIIGLILYILTAELTGLPLPIYLIPSVFDDFTTVHLFPMALSLLGHFIASILISLFILFVTFLFGRFTFSTTYYPAWDDFIRSCVKKRWVVIRLTNNEVYAGYIKIADVSGARSERDVVLAEPAFYDEKKKEYIILPYQELFLPGSIISSIATVYDPEKDQCRRITAIYAPLFNSEGRKDD